MLKKLNLFSNYKTLNKDLHIDFGEKNIFCFIGLNGSGKSQVLSLINEIITFSLEGIGIDKVYYELILEVKNDLYIISNKLYKNKPVFSITKNLEEQSLEVSVEELKYNVNLVSYSSSSITSLSNSYYHSNLSRLHKFKQSVIEETPKYNSNLPVIFIDEKLSKILIICLSIFYREEINNLLNNKLDLKKIKNIQYRYKKHYYKKNYISKGLDFPLLEGDYSVEKLFYQNVENNVLGNLDREKIEKIEKRFKYIPETFFNVLVTLENTNLLGISKKNREVFLKTLHRLNEKVKNVYSNNHFFIESVNFTNNVEIDYLSDGEKQLLNTLGLVLMYQSSESKKETLFLFDEPTTHLNVNWKSDYIFMLMKALNHGTSNGQLIFSTHNPELISELENTQVIKMNDGKAFKIPINTFGKDKDDISMELFDTTELLSKYVLNVYQSFYEKLKDPNFNSYHDLIKEVKTKMASSTDRTLLISAIRNKMEE